MNLRRHDRPAEAFFLKAGSGERFCLYHAPAPDKEMRGSFIYVHPFAEEMNMSRRMAALQARSLANAGFGVLQIDLFGCGESSGDFSEARWDIWKEDVAIARKWLENRSASRVNLWGLRLGALLALDSARDSADHLDRLVLWQPVINGESFLTQFLRIRLASEMLNGGKDKTKGTRELRDALAAGKSVEVAGYELSPQLAASIDSMNAADLAGSDIRVHWFELVAAPGRTMPVAAAKVTQAWERRGVDLRLQLMTAPSFWASQEIIECPELLAATTHLFAEVRS